MVTIKKLDVKNKKDFKVWVDFPNNLYKDNPHYVPYLFSDEMNLTNPKKNVAFDECEAAYFLAYKDGQVAGRVAGIIQKSSNAKDNAKRVRLSRLDFIDDAEVVRALTKAVEDFGREKGMDTVHGPYGFNDLEREGMRVYGFDEDATFATNYNYPYYLPRLLECGYEVENRWNEYRIHIPEVLPEKVERVAEIASKRYGLRIPEEKNLKIFVEKYLDELFDVYDAAYSTLPGTMPITEKMRVQMKDQFLLVINKNYVAVVLNPENKVVGLALAFPSLTKVFKGSRGRLTPKVIFRLLKERRHPTAMEFAIIGALPGYDTKGAAALIIKHIHSKMIQDGIKTAESNPELETNNKIQSLWNVFETEQHKRNATVIKKII
ncbi:MAG TPA: N-acetyltransferase [Firmicutes bacterium]|nr:N-acetyltransferase [Bacillota bacterium]